MKPGVAFRVREQLIDHMLGALSATRLQSFSPWSLHPHPEVSSSVATELHESVSRWFSSPYLSSVYLMRHKLQAISPRRISAAVKPPQRAHGDTSTPLVVQFCKRLGFKRTQ